MTISIPHHHVAKPTEAQAAAGNYKKAKLRLYGLDISIENPKGSTRSGKDPDGKEWRVTMPAHYGYILGTVGKDLDHVDCYIGPNPKADRVYIINQIDAKTRKFDEHKCMLGYSSRSAALKDYVSAFSDGKGRDRMGGVVEMPVDQFKTWVKSHNTKSPARSAYAGGGIVDDTINPLLPLIESVKKFEGYAPRAAWDYSQYTNGYGTRAAYPGEAIDRATADTRLTQELSKAKSIVDQFAPNAPQGVKDALTSLTFNAGANWMRSGLGASVSSGDYAKAQQLFTQYNKAGGQVLPGLVDRRKAEAQWFNLGSTPERGQTEPVTSVPAGPDLSWTKPYSVPDTEKTASPLASLLQKYTQPSTTPIDFDGNVRWGDGSVQGLFNPANMR